MGLKLQGEVAALVPQHNTFAAWICSSKKARVSFLNRLQAAGHVHLAHFSAACFQGFNRGGCKAFFFQQAGAVQRAKVGQVNRLLGVQAPVQCAVQHLRGVVNDQRAAKTLYGVLNWGMLPQQAINLPNFASLNGPTLLEQKRFPAATIDALKARGHEVRESEMTSGLQAITRGQAHGTQLWLGGADPRREGLVMGD